MICSSVNLFFTSNLLSYGIGLQSQTLLKSGGTSGLTYDSLNALTRALHEKHGQQLGTIQATQYWSLESSQFSLAEEANQLSAAEK